MTAKPATVTELREKAEAAAAATPDPAVDHTHDTLAAALVAALRELTVVEKDSTANLGTYSYDYATLPGLVKATRPTLARHGIVALTPLLEAADGRLAVTVILLHQSGERLECGPFPFPPGRDAQATGSMVTYMRRYALLAALGMAAGDDDDGARAVPAFVWTVGAVKARLVELLDGDTAKAAEAWKLGGGDTEPPSDVLADRLAAEWKANQPAEGDG